MSTPYLKRLPPLAPTFVRSHNSTFQFEQRCIDLGKLLSVGLRARQATLFRKATP